MARLYFFGFLVLVVIYICLSFYSRGMRRDKLEREWDEGGIAEDRDLFVRKGLEDYDGSLRRKLIIGVFVVPILFIGTLIYVTNFM